MSDDAVERHLAALAEAYGVATAYTDADDQRVEVSADTVRAALAAMGVEAPDEAAAQRALDAHHEAQANRLLPDAHVARRGRPATFTIAAGRTGTATLALEATLTLEDGSQHELSATEGSLALPEDLPLGYHRLQAWTEDHVAEARVVVAPSSCPVPQQRRWGWMAQLYQLRSATSWGMGDAGDLRRLGERSAAALGAGFVVCNPLHAVAPTEPVEPSPYFPSSRRFTNPLYLCVTDIPEVGGLTADARNRVDALASQAEQLNAADRIDYDAVWRYKLDALELVHGVPRNAERTATYTAYRQRQGQGLVDFATFCALAERHGLPWQSWPAQLHHPDHPAVAAAREELADRVELYTWLQWLADEQLAAAHDGAVAAGMPIGVIHDLAVGVDPGGADAWALQDDLAGEVRVGAPPDAFNQRGQNWSQPPLRPDRLAATGYRPFRDMLRSVLAHAGGIRIDHVLGLFRLYWIPQGAQATEGTYVRYPGEDLLGVLALEAERAGAVVVGEDLGTVEAGVRDRLRDAGVLGSRVLYFERDEDEQLIASSAYPELALASVATHDLPTAAGWWRDAATDVQVELGLLAEDRSETQERARTATEREEMIALLRAEGLVGRAPTEAELVTAMHAFLARTPCRLVAASPADAVGDTRQPNMPGTTDEYPNWRLPLAEPGPSGGLQPTSLERLLDHPRTAELAAVLRQR